MGILQNIIKSINTAIDSIDLSGYQLISGKNTANGYTGLNAESKVDNIYIDKSKDYIQILFDTDFTDVMYYTVSGNVFLIPFNTTTSGTSGVLANPVKTTITDGNLSLCTGISSGGFIELYTQNNFSFSNVSGYEIWWQCGFFLPILSDGSQRFEIRLDMDIGAITGTNSDRIIISYLDTANSGKFQILVKNNGTETILNTEITAVAGTHYDIKFKITNAGILPYINDVAQSIITSNIPYDRLIRIAGFSIKKSVGSTARYLHLNYLKVYKVSTAKRY